VNFVANAIVLAQVPQSGKRQYLAGRAELIDGPDRSSATLGEKAGVGTDFSPRVSAIQDAAVPQVVGVQERVATIAFAHRSIRRPRSRWRPNVIPTRVALLAKRRSLAELTVRRAFVLARVLAAFCF
jgi:hypothetical protein